MESPSSTVRRRAWINSSRQWPTLEDLEESLCNLPSASIADDDVFSDGCFTGKIENWLLGCGPEASSENKGQLSFESVLNHDDDLGLGADASVLNSGELLRAAGPSQHSKPPQSRVSYTGLCLPSLSLGHSMASSCPSFSTCKTTSSVSEVLQMCSEDAEETLFALGFGCEEPQAHVRIPPRFFTFPSQAQGINFRLFLDSQIRRIREEDPGLSLASRFRQVQVLTAMANAFYSLYSHVSRTPLQKLATPEFTLSSPVERIQRFRSSVRSEPRSPVERLKDTVSKMCLYTGSPRGSDSTSPQPSPRKRSSLSDVDVAAVKVKSGAPKRLDLEGSSQSNVDVRVEADDADSLYSKQQTHQSRVDRDILQHGGKVGHKETHGTGQIDAGEGVQPTDRNHSVKTPPAWSVSGDTVIEADLPFFSRQAERLSEIQPVKAACDLICPRSQNTSNGTERTDTSCPESHQHHNQHHAHARISEPDEDSHTCDAASSAEAGWRPVPPRNGSHPHYCITVTGSEGNDISPCSLSTPDSSHTSSVLPVRTREDSFNKERTWHLDPLTYQGLGHYSKNPRQVNSFELEEVHSAGEDDLGQSDNTRPMTSLLAIKHQCKGEVVRGDSMQSDSSGYADEDLSPSLDRSGR